MIRPLLLALLPLLCAPLRADDAKPRFKVPNLGTLKDNLDPNLAQAVTKTAVQPARRRGRYPIIFLPGVAGSFLNRVTDGKSQRVWMDGGILANSNLPFPILDYLKMTPGGSSIENIVPDEVMMRKEITPGNALTGPDDTVYAGFVDFIKSKGYSDRSLFQFPYDFRLLPDNPRTLDRLKTVIDRAKRAADTDKVILIGHSMGGLVARSYIVRERGAGVAALLGVGTPWLGAPIAFKALGPEQWDFGIPGLNKGAVQNVITNWPGVYTLTPGAEYFDAYSSGYFFQESETKPIQTAAQQRAKARSSNAARYDDAASWRRKILDGNAYGVQNFVIANGARNTVTRYKQKHEKGWIGEDKFSFPTPDLGLGDDTVPLKSGFLNNQPLIGATQRFTVDGSNFNHSRLTEFRAVQNQIWSIVDGVNQGP